MLHFGSTLRDEQTHMYCLITPIGDYKAIIKMKCYSISIEICSIRVPQYDCSIRVISVLIFTIVDAQVLAMLFEVILVNFNESISKITQTMIIIMMMVMCFILSWQDVGIVSIVSSNNL